MKLGEPPGRDDGDCRAKARSRGQCFYRLHRVRCAGAQPFRCPAPSIARPQRGRRMQSFGSKRRTVRGNGARCRTGRAHDTRTARGHRRPGRNHHHCARGRAGPRVSRYRLGHARCVRRCGRPSALVETRHPARDGHPCHRRTRADACPDGLGAHDVRRPYERISPIWRAAPSRGAVRRRNARCSISPVTRWPMWLWHRSSTRQRCGKAWVRGWRAELTVCFGSIADMLRGGNIGMASRRGFEPLLPCIAS